MAFPQTLPGRWVRKASVHPRLLYAFRAADLALTPRTGQAATFAHALSGTDVGGSIVGSAGRLRAMVHSQPRFEAADLDGDGVRETLGLLVEQKRRNLLLRSQELDNAAWTKTRATVSADIAFPTAPDGSTTADSLVEDATAAATHEVDQAVTVTAGRRITFSRFLRAGERTKVRLRVLNGADSFSAAFDLSAGTLLEAVAAGAGSVIAGNLEPVGDGWYRCWVTGQVNGSSTSVTCRTLLLDAAAAESYDGDGASGIQTWGAQAERRESDADAYEPSSYIPTTSAVVDRPAETLKHTPAWQRQDWTIYARFDAGWLGLTTVPSSQLPTVFQLRDAADNNAFNLFRAAGSASLSLAHKGAGGSALVVTAAHPTSPTSLEVACQMDHANGRVRFDPGTGVLGAWNTMNNRWVTNPEELWVGSGSGNDGFLRGRMFDLKVAAGLYTTPQMREML